MLARIKTVLRKQTTHTRTQTALLIVLGYITGVLFDWHVGAVLLALHCYTFTEGRWWDSEKDC